MELLYREFIYIWYYSVTLLEQIFPYWVIGMLIGSAVSIFAKSSINQFFSSLEENKIGVLGVFIASGLGIASPLCMYGTIPICASFVKSGMKDDWVGAFMMSSILLNPQLIIYSGALGTTALMIRIIVSFSAGSIAGILLRYFYHDHSFFRFTSFDEVKNKDIDPNIIKRYLKNLSRNIKATDRYFLVGIILSALFQRYVPSEAITFIFGGNEAFGFLMAATIGVPLYACGGGTIPLLQQWLYQGMSLGSATTFMITGPATKITNLGALKIILGVKNFIIYLIYIISFSLISGLIVNLII